MFQMPSRIRRGSRTLASIAFVAGLASACGAPPATSSGQDGWMHGTPDEKFDIVARQLRGFDMAMVETGYRYEQLFWAGEDQNWAYAAYHLGKIGTAIENGFERRPRRAGSSKVFLTTALPALGQAIEQQSVILFRERFVELTAACNTCHTAEKVEFVRVVQPTVRTGSAR